MEPRYGTRLSSVALTETTEDQGTEEVEERRSLGHFPPTGGR